MPSSRRRSHHRSRRYDQRDEEACSGPVNALIFMFSACSTIMNVDSLHRSGGKYDSDDETEVTQSSSHSSERRRSRRRRDRSSTRNSNRSRDLPRSKSHSVRPDYRSRSLERRESQEKIRSRSFSRSHQLSGFDSLPAVQLPENTLIQVKDEDDDVSAISAGTLEQMDRLQILQQANKSLRKRQQTAAFAAPHVTSDFFKPVFTNKENIINCSSPDRSRDDYPTGQSGRSRASGGDNFSMASSTGTSEFESVWNTPTKLSASGRERKRSDDIVDEDNYHLQGKHSSPSKSGPHSDRVPYETPNTRKMKRQIQTDWIGTIAEGIYSDEEEI